MDGRLCARRLASLEQARAMGRKARGLLPSPAGWRRLACLWFGLLIVLGTAARPGLAREQVIEPPASFLAAAFGSAPPGPTMLWLTKPLQERIAAVLGHPLPVLRLRYWRKDDRTAWILEEIGKSEPITAGFVVEKGRIVRASVLVYRESRGYEIRYPQFRAQFTGAGLDDEGHLDRRIDGIAGATLSVDAMIRMARTALVLDAWVRAKTAPRPEQGAGPRR